MNRLSLLILFLVFPLPLSAQQYPGNAIEQSLYKSYQRIGYWSDLSRTHKNEEIGKAAADSLNNAAIRFKKELLACLLSPASMNYKFIGLEKSAVDITTSKDNLLRIYSWLSMTNHPPDYDNIVQYIVGGKLLTTTLPCRRLGNPGYYYTKIYTLNTHGKTYYLVVFNGIYSDKISGEGIEVLSIDNGTLNDDVKLIKTASGLHNTLSYDYDFDYWDNRDELLNSRLQYNEATQTISIPVVLANGQITKSTIKYKFTGQYFEKIK